MSRNAGDERKKPTSIRRPVDRTNASAILILDQMTQQEDREMSFQLSCPQCGPRDVYEFRYGGQINDEVPANFPGVQKERWYHRLGCRRWLLAERDIRTNHVVRTDWLGGHGA